MAVIETTHINPATTDKIMLKSWANMAVGDVSEATANAGFADRSVQVEGEFGVGGEVVVEGSNDGTNYHTLKDFSGVDLTFTAPGLRSIATLTRYSRVRVTDGDGTTLITTTMLQRRPIA